MATHGQTVAIVAEHGRKRADIQIFGKSLKFAKKMSPILAISEKIGPNHQYSDQDSTRKMADFAYNGRSGRGMAPRSANWKARNMAPKSPDMAPRPACPPKPPINAQAGGPARWPRWPGKRPYGPKLGPHARFRGSGQGAGRKTGQKHPQYMCPCRPGKIFEKFW